jgi:hypothetical protein
LSFVIVILYGSKIYWGLWLKVKGNWRAELQ